MVNDYFEGFSDRDKGIPLDTNKSCWYQMGWKDCDWDIFVNQFVVI